MTTTRYASNYQNDIEDGYSSPQLVSHLMEDTTTPKQGPLESVEETPTPHDYYDGSLNINKVKVKCDIYSSLSDCTHQSGCGWCGEKNGCIFGTSFGPLQPCVQSSYIGGIRQPSREENYKYIKEQVGGVTATIISKAD